MRGQGRIFQRRKPGSGFYAGHAVAWFVNGREHREAVGCACAPGRKSCSLADDLLLKRRAARARGPLMADEERLTINDALDGHVLYLQGRRVKSLAKIVGHHKPLREHLGGIRVLELGPAHFLDYIAWRHGTKVSTELAWLRAAIGRLHKEKRLLHPPHVPVPAQGPPRQGFLEPETFARMLPLMGDASGEDPALYREMAEFAYQTGWRYSEVTGLRWEWVFLRDGECRLPDTKNGHGRLLVLVGRALEIIQGRWRQRDMSSPWVFHNRGRRVKDALRNHVKAGAAAVGVTITPHDFRRSAVRNLVRAGVHKTTAKSITGHVSDDVFSRYNIQSAEDQRQAFEATAAYAAGRQNLITVATVR